MPALAALSTLAEHHRDRLAVLHRLAQTGLAPEGDDLIIATAALFDRLATDAPEAGVAFYSFGDPQALGIATAEGAPEFHFLRGEVPYKYAWGALPRSTVRRTIRRA